MKQNFYIALIALLFTGCGDSSKNAKRNNDDTSAIAELDTTLKTQNNRIISTDTVPIPKAEIIDHLGYDKVLLFEEGSERELLYINLNKKSLNFKISYRNDTSKFELSGDAKLLNVGEESIGHFGKSVRAFRIYADILFRSKLNACFAPSCTPLS